MASGYIGGMVRKLISDCGTRNPFKICRDIGVMVEYKDIGKLKGMYACIQYNRFVIIGDSLDDRTRKIVCAHELGHDQLHRELAENKALQEFMLYDMASRPEYEANIFASHLLLPDEDVLKLSVQGFDAVQMAELLGTDINLVLIKLHELNRAGYNLNVPNPPRKGFLKRL